MPRGVETAYAAALRGGETYYYTGKPCKHGHVTRRHTASGSCMTCRAKQRTASAQRRRVQGCAARRRHRKTPAGLLVQTYSNMLARSRGQSRAETSHCWLNCRVLPRAEFMEWGLGDADFQRLHAEWAAAGHPVRLSPSIDRIDSDGHYEHPNIRFLPQWLNSSRRLNV